jgi:hypothetical protein
MFKRGLLKVATYVTPRKGLRHWAIYLASNHALPLIGPFQTREQARERLRELAVL